MDRHSLIFTRSANPLLDLPIRAFEGGEAGHVGVRIDDQVIHSAFLQRGVRRQTMTEFLDGRVVVADIDMDLPNPRAGDDWLAQQVGKPYDWQALLGWLAWRDTQDGRAWYCSELALGWMLASGASVAQRRSGRFGVRLLLEIAHARLMGRAGAYLEVQTRTVEA